MYATHSESDHEVSRVCLLEDDGPGVEQRPPIASHRGRADEATVSEIMSKRVRCVRADLDLQGVEQLLLDTGISGVPVVDETARPIGIVSKTDILRARHEHEHEGQADVSARCVADIMVPVALCLPANESVARAAALMAFEGVHRVPVVGPTGQVVGLVSPLDILRWLAREHGYVIANPL